MEERRGDEVSQLRKSGKAMDVANQEVLMVMNDVVRLFEWNVAMLRGFVFDRQAPGVFEKSESEDVTWRIVALPDRKDEPYLEGYSGG